MSLEVQFLFKLIFWIFSIYGITQIIVESTLFKPVRQNASHRFIHSIINCFLCTSVWVAFFISLMIWSPFKQAFYTDLCYTDIALVMFDAADAFDSLSPLILSMLQFVIKLISAFFDGMLGSAIVWLIHVHEISKSK